MGKTYIIDNYYANKVPFGTIRLRILHNLDSTVQIIDGCTKLSSIGSVKLERIEHHISKPNRLNPTGKSVSANVVEISDLKELTNVVTTLFGNDCTIEVDTLIDINEVTQRNKIYLLRFPDYKKCGIMFYTSITDELTNKIRMYLQEIGYTNISFNRGDERFNVEFDYNAIYPQDLEASMKEEGFSMFRIFTDLRDFRYKLQDEPSKYKIIPVREKEYWDFSGDDSSLDSRFH